jgi:hypothetical protein
MYMKISVLIVLLTCVMAASAQVVNIEEYRIRTDSSGWSGSADAAGYINKNSDLVYSIITNIQLQYKYKRTLWWMLSDLETVQANEQEAFVNAGFQHFRFNYKITDRWVWEAFVQGQFNGPLGVEWKVLSGTGPRYKVIQTEKFRMYAAALYMQETERNTDATETIYFNRMSSYVSLTWEPRENSRFSNTTYFQPVLNDFADYRISSNTSLKAFLSKVLYLELEYSLLFDTRPPFEVPTTVYNLKSGIGLEF